MPRTLRLKLSLNKIKAKYEGNLSLPLRVPFEGSHSLFTGRPRVDELMIPENTEERTSHGALSKDKLNVSLLCSIKA